MRTHAEITSLADAVRRPGQRRRHRRAGGLHPPDPGRRRAGDHPPAQARPDAGADDPGHRLRPADRRRLRAQADLLLGRQPGRRLAAPLPRGGAERTTLEIEEHSHAGMANRYVAAASNLPVRRAARLQRHVAARAHGHDQADHLPVHRRAADGRPGARPRRRDHPRAAGRPAGQRPALGPGRRAEGDRAGRQAQRSSRSRRSSTSSSPGPTASCSRAGSSPASPHVPGGAKPSYAQDYYDRDNQAYKDWDAVSKDRERVRRLARGGCAHERLRSRRDDERRRGARAARRERVLRRDRPAEHRRQPRAAHARAGPRAGLRGGRDRRQAAAAAALDRRRHAGRDRRRDRRRAGDVQLLGPVAAGSTSASSARPRSTASPTSTRP